MDKEYQKLLSKGENILMRYSLMPFINKFSDTYHRKEAEKFRSEECFKDMCLAVAMYEEMLIALERMKSLE